MEKRKRLIRTFSSVMQSIAGCITSTKNTNGTPSTGIWQNGSTLLNNPVSQNLDGQDELLGSRLQSYEVYLSDEIIYILAASAEEAAWYALELSNDKHSKLLDVRLIDE